MEIEKRTQTTTETTAINIEQVKLISKRPGPTDIRDQYRTNLQKATE